MNIKRISAVVMSLAMIGTSLPFSDIAISFSNKNIITANAEEGYATDAYPETNEPSSDYYEDATMAETEPWTDAYEDSVEYTTRYTEKTESTTIISGTTPLTGKCGDNISYTFIESGVIVISGTGEMEEYDNTSSPFYNNGAIKKVIVNNGITSISDYAFSGCCSLENIIIPDTITSIGAYAFNNCVNLKSISLPDSLLEINPYVFCNCKSLENVAIPDTVISIGEYAFKDCQSFTEIKIPEHVDSIGEGAFQDCTNLESINLPDLLLEINPYIFYNCENLKSIIIPDMVTSIGEYAFKDCQSFAEIKIPEHVSSIGEGAFQDCINLESIKLPDSLSEIDSYTFYNCENLKNIIISDTVTSMGSYSFYQCTSLTEISIPDSVTSIGPYSFYLCTSLTEISIPDTVTSIGEYATYGCRNLKDVYYSGMKSGWDKVSVGTYNGGILIATIHFLEEEPTTSLSTEPPTSETTGTKVEFEIGNISAKAGDGYGEEGSDTEWSVILPIMVNNDTGLAGINGTLNVSSDLAKVFQLEKISLENEDTGKDGPYTGTFTAETKNWAYSIACSGYRNWEKQFDGTPFIYYYVKVTKDKSLIARVADEMEIELDSDENGSYYKFPIEWNTSNSDANVISDINQIERIPLLKNGSIKVYVNSEVETTEPVTTTEPVATTTRPIATTGYRTTAVTTTTQVPMKASPKSTTIEVGESFSIKIDAADNPSVIYVTNPTNVVVVDANGKVTGINSGETTIAAITEDGRSDVVRVTVLPAPMVTTVARTTTKVTYAPLIVEPKSTEIFVNDSFDIAVSGGDGNYTFTSMDDSIVEVGSNGFVLGLNPGTSIIKVKDGIGNIATAIVTVKALTTTAATTLTKTTTTRVTYVDLVASPKNITIEVGEVESISVKGGDGNYTFVSSDDDVAMVASNGKVIGLKAGISVVTVSDGLGNKESILVTVIRPETTATTTMRVTTTTRVTYADLTVEPSLIIFDVNESVKINVSGGDGNYTFISNDESIAEVGQNGLVTGLKPGETVIKVRDGEGNLATVKVTVKQPATTTVTTRATTTTGVTYAELVVSPKEILIDVNEEAKITVSGGDGNYAFESNDESIAEIGQNGLVTGLKPGETVIKVRDGEGNLATVKVTVKQPATTTFTTPSAVVTTTTTVTTRVTTTITTNSPLKASPDEITIPEGGRASITVTGGDGDYRFVVSDEDYVIVSSYGTVMGLKPGTAIVTVIDGEGNTDTVYVYVTALIYTTTEITYRTTARTTTRTTYRTWSTDPWEETTYPQVSEEVTAEDTYPSWEATTSVKESEEASATEASHTVSQEPAIITIGTVIVKPGTKTVDVPVTIFNNSGFAGGGFVFTLDPKLTFNEVKGGLVASPEEWTLDNLVSVTFVKDTNITGNGVMFTLQFELPDVIKAGDVYSITGSLDTFCDEYRYDLPVKIVDGAIKVDDEEYETTEITYKTTARATTRTTYRTWSTDPWEETTESETRSNPEFVIGNISAKPGYGYGEDSTEGSTDENSYSLSVPLKINKDCGIAGISAKINVDDNFKKVFQLESISLSDNGYSGPYSGRFITNPDKWEFALTNTANGNWMIQPDGTPIIWYNIKITKDESVIASAAESLGIDLEKDTTGTYYKFPLEWSNYKVVDTYGTKINSKFKDGCIKVYVGVKSETTSATDSWAETTYTTKKVLTTAASTTVATKKAPVVNSDPLKVDVNNVELEVGKTFKIKANQENLTYATSDNNIAIVSKLGEITAISAGTVVITVINSDKETVSITVTVKNSVTTTSVTTTTKPPVTTPTKPNIILGDVNIDGAVDSKDAVLVLKDYAQVLTGSKSSIALERGDINGDNSIDSKDAVKILKYYANKMVGNTDIDIRNV